MKKISKFLAFAFATFSIVAAASCSSSIDIKGYIENVEATSTTFTIDVEFDSNSKLSDGTANTYVTVYDMDDEQVCKSSLSFSDKIYTNASTEITNLEESTEYTIKLFATYDGYSYELDKTTAKTLAAEEENSEENPYEIKSLDELKAMTDDLAGHYKLMADIDCGDESVSIFTLNKKFTGTFDGNGHTISNYKITSQAYTGLFGYIDGGSVSNLTVTGVNCTLNRSELHLGGVIGYATGATLTNITVKNVTFDFAGYSKSTAYIGGLAGQLVGCTVENCNAENIVINVTQARLQTSIGGFAGSIESQCAIKNCYVNEANLSACVWYNDSNSNGYTYVGGFAGLDKSGAKKTVESCYAIATITITELSEKTDTATIAEDHKVAVGGFIGSNGLTGYTRITDCVAIADITATLKFPEVGSVGGFVGCLSDSQPMHLINISNCFYCVKKDGINITVNVDASKAESNMSASLFAGRLEIKSEDTYSTSTAITSCFANEDKITCDGLALGAATVSTDYSVLSEAMQQVITNYNKE